MNDSDLTERKFITPNKPTLASPIEKFKAICQNGPVYAIEDRYDGIKYGKVTVKDGRICVSCFQNEKPEAYIFRDILSCAQSGSVDLPKTAFLQLLPCGGDSGGEGGGDTSFDVVIETDADSPRAKNFIFLCSGLKGTSFKGMNYLTKSNGPCGLFKKFLGSNEELIDAEDSFYRMAGHGNTPIYPVVEGIAPEDSTPQKEGSVYGMAETNCFVDFPLKDCQFKSVKFGDFVSGFQKLKEQKAELLWVAECGLVLNY